MSDWIPELLRHREAGERCVLVSVAATSGSAPREAGAKMVVCANDIHGTIGGGNLEYQAIVRARSRLAAAGAAAGTEVIRFPLGPALGQCCGGVAFLSITLVDEASDAWLRPLAACCEAHDAALLVLPVGGGEGIVVQRDRECLDQLPGPIVNAARRMLDPAPGDPGVRLLTDTAQEAGPGRPGRLLMELVRPSDFNVAIFGAGHVGQAIVTTLSAAASCAITWIDDRPDAFPDAVPANVRIRTGVMPLDEVGALVPGSYVLVMTHSHQLDQSICEQVLRRGEFAFLGLIGSATKRRRFAKRLRERGISEQQLRRLVCPIGIGGIRSKRPGAIAVAAVAQILQQQESALQSGSALQAL